MHVDGSEKSSECYFVTLPLECFENVCGNLDFRSFVKLGICDKWLYTYMKAHKCWKNIYIHLYRESYFRYYSYIPNVHYYSVFILEMNHSRLIRENIVTKYLSDKFRDLFNRFQTTFNKGRQAINFNCCALINDTPPA